MATPRSIVESPEAALAELTAHTRPTWLARSASLPFGELYGDEFEVFCYLLVSAERPGRRVIYYGKTADGGRDIIAETEDDRVELVQCKCFNRTIDASVVREDLAKVFTNLHLGIIPQRPNRVVFYAAPGLSAEANDLLTVQGKWLDVCEEALRAHWTKRKLAQAHGPFPQALLDFARTWWPETDVVPGVKLTEWAERHPRLIEQFFALQKVVDNSAVEALRDQLLPQNLDRLWNYDEQALGKADALFDEGKYVEAAGILEALIEELGEDIALESRIRRTRARLNLTACWVNLRDHDKAKAVLRWIRSDDIDRSDRGTQLRYARMRLMLDSKADVSRWLDGDDARPLRQIRALLRDEEPEQGLDDPDVLALAARRTLSRGLVATAADLACEALDRQDSRPFGQIQHLDLLVRCLSQTIYEVGENPVPEEKRGPLLERIKAGLKLVQDVPVPLREAWAQTRYVFARLTSLGPIPEAPPQKGRPLPKQPWQVGLEDLQRGINRDPDGTLPDVEVLLARHPEKEPIEHLAGRLLLRAGRTAEAIEHARIAFRLLPSERNRFLLAESLERARQWEEAWSLAESLPDDLPDVRLLKASLLVVLPESVLPTERRLTLLQDLRRLSPREPEIRTAPAVALANLGRIEEAANSIWEDLEWLWQEGIELPVSTLAQAKELQRAKDDETRLRRWRRLAQQLEPMRADPEAEQLFTGLFFDLEQPVDLRPPDLGKLTEAGYGKFVSVDDLIALLKDAHRLRHEWSAGRLPLDSPWRRPSVSQMVDEVVRGELVWPAPAELLPLHDAELLRGLHPDLAPPDTVVLGLLELYLLAEVDGLDHLGPVEVCTFRDCLDAFNRDRPAHQDRREPRFQKLEALRQSEEGKSWHRLVWPEPDETVDESAWAAGHEAILIQSDTEGDGLSPEALVASIRQVPKAERSNVEAWLRAARLTEPVDLPHPRVALSAEVVDHRIIDLLDVLLYAFQQILLTPCAVARIERQARWEQERKQREERWHRLARWLEAAQESGRLIDIQRPTSNLLGQLPAQVPEANRQWVAHILGWHEVLVTHPRWRLVCADRFIHGLFTHFSDVGLRSMLGTQEGMRELAERYRPLRGQITTLAGHLAQMGADPEVLRRLARLGDIGAVRFPSLFDDLWLNPDERALAAMQRTLAPSGAPVAAWFCMEAARAALRWWGERPLEDARAAFRRMIAMLEAIGGLRALLVELVRGALLDVDALRGGIMTHLLEEVVARPAYVPTLRVIFAQAVSTTSRLLGPRASFPGHMALKVGTLIENRLATATGATRSASFWGTMETLAIWSGAWADRSMKALVLNSESGKRLDAETLLQRVGRSRQRNMALRRPWLLDVSVSGGKKADPFRVVLPPAAVLLRMNRSEAATTAKHLAELAVEDGALQDALMAFAATPEDPKAREQLAYAEAVSPVRLFSHAPDDFVGWGTFQLSASAYLSRIQDFRALLSDLPWQGEQTGEEHIGRLIGPGGTWSQDSTRHGLAFHLAEVPGQHMLAAIEQRVSGTPPAELFREVQAVLSTPEERSAGLVSWMVAEAWWVAHQHPEISTGQSAIRTREVVSQLIEGVLVEPFPTKGSADAMAAPTKGRGLLAVHELGLLRLCRHVISRCVDAPFAPWPERLWLTWRLHVWLLHQIEALDPLMRMDAIQKLATAGHEAPLVTMRCAFDPAVFTSSRDLRLVQVLGALVMMGSHLKRAHELEFSPLTDQAAASLMKLVAEGPTLEGQERDFPLFPWPRPTTVPELALQALLLLRQDDWLKLPPDVRLKWLDRLTGDQVRGLGPSVGWALVASYAELLSPAELDLARARLEGAERSDLTSSALLAVLLADEGIDPPADFEERMQETLTQDISRGTFAACLRFALARAPGTFDSLARSFLSSSADPIHLAQGLSLLVTRPEPEVAQAARALVAALSKEAPFCNDPRMQTLFDLTGVT